MGFYASDMLGRRIDWTTKPWWVRPVVAVTVGLAIGLVINVVIFALSAPYNTWLLALVLLAALAFMLYSLWDLRRWKRDMDEKIAEWKRVIGDS